jgi:DNA mismatch repair protein MutS2
VLERETLTAGRLDALAARLDAQLEALPARRDRRRVEAEEPAAGTWQVGHVARSRSGGWQGRIASIDDRSRRATLEAGALRVAVDVDDLEPANATAGGDGTTSRAERPRSGRRGDFGAGPNAPAPGSRATGARARPAGTTSRSIPNTLDLRGARVEEALEALDQYLDKAAVAQAGRVTIVHGHGSGALRDAVRDVLASHPLVREWRPGERGEGGDGASVVSL